MPVRGTNEMKVNAYGYAIGTIHDTDIVLYKNTKALPSAKI